MGMAGRQQVRRGMTPYSKLVVRSNPPLPLQVRYALLLVSVLVMCALGAWVARVIWMQLQQHVFLP